MAEVRTATSRGGALAHPAVPPRVMVTGAVGVAVALAVVALLATAAGRYVVEGVSVVAGLLGAGTALFLVPTLDEPAAQPLRRLSLGAAVVGFGAGLLILPFAVMDVGGRGIAGLGDPLARAVVLRSGDYEAVLTRCAGLVALAIGARAGVSSRPARALLLGGAVLVAGSFLLTGHVRSHGPAAVVVACGLAHTLGAAGWFGGLAGLAVTLRSATDAAAARTVRMFAGVMTGVVTMVLAGGLGLAFLYLPSPRALVTTAYGGVLLVKVGLVAAVLVVSSANHARLVPRTAAGEKRARRLLRLNVTVEQIGLLAVVLVTEILMHQNPGA